MSEQQTKPEPATPISAWMNRGACRAGSVNPELFFPGPGESDKEGKGICWSCPVMATCRAYALDNANLRGVWGGLNDRDRNKIRASGDVNLPPGYKRCSRCQQAKRSDQYYERAAKCKDCAKELEAEAYERRKAQRRQNAVRTVRT